MLRHHLYIGIFGFIRHRDEVLKTQNNLYKRLAKRALSGKIKPSGQNLRLFDDFHNTLTIKRIRYTKRFSHIPYLAVRAPLVCNGALVALRRRARYKPTACLLRCNKALTARPTNFFGRETT